MSPMIVPATRELLERFYGRPQSRSMRALVAVLDGEPICVGGTLRQGDKIIAFAEVTPVMRQKYRKTGMRMAHLVMAMIRAAGLPAFTAADCSVDAAERFLEHLGFTKQPGGFYAWRP